MIKAVNSAVPIYTMQTVKLPMSICDELDRINRNFLWGSDGEQKKVHLVDWDSVTLSKKEGGLGTRKSKYMNQALLSKAAWRIQKGDTSVWSEIFRKKYLRGRSFKEYQPVGAASSTWRGIVKGADLVNKGSIWRIRNGAKVNFWTDRWLDVGVLEDFAIKILLDMEKAATVENYLENMGWNIQKLCTILPHHIVDKIVSIFAEKI